MSKCLSLPRRVVVLVALSLIVLLVAPFVGITSISLSNLRNPSGVQGEIFWSLRVPRVAVAFLVGSGLAVAGAVFQAIFRNVLATPFTLGVASAAALGATLHLALGIGAGVVGGVAVAVSGGIAAMIAALLATALLLVIARRAPPVTILLSGVVISFFFSSLTVCVQYASDLTGVFRVTRWMMGSIESSSLESLVVVAPVVVLAGLAALWFAPELDLIACGDELALSRGVELMAVRAVLIAVVSLLVGALVSVCGPIGFVGLVVPHIARLWVGALHRRMVVVSGFLGGAFLVICDAIARVVLAPAEVPVGVITALVGGPFFVWALLCSRESAALNG